MKCLMISWLRPLKRSPSVTWPVGASKTYVFSMRTQGKARCSLLNWSRARVNANGLEKLVASTTLTEVTWNASLLKGDVAKELAALKRQDGGHILKYGVTALDRTLIENKLVDEYDLWIMPARVGQGKRAFADVESNQLDLELLRTHRFAYGGVVLTYRPR